MTTSALLNDFATRSFRDVADKDYILARLAYRHGLFPQFQWSALQALEKYFKAILLYNRIEAKKIGHSLSKAQERIKLLPFEVRLSKSTLGLIKHLDEFGAFRYLEVSYFVLGPKLVELDKAVWEIRRYCRILDYKCIVNGREIEALPLEIRKIKSTSHLRPNEIGLIGGMLESILKKSTHPSRPALIWQNAYYSARPRKRVRMQVHFIAENAPLTLHAELLDEVLKYCFLPSAVEKAYRGRS
jgi:hypothetical protein